MALLGEIGRRVRILFRQRGAARDLDEEMRFHVQQRAARLIARGVPPDAAYVQARHRFGNVLAMREDALAVWSSRWLEQLMQDVRFGARTLRRNLLFSVSAMLTLGIATGATTAVFSLVNGVLLQPLPYAEPTRIVAITGRNWSEDRGGRPDEVTGPIGSLELETLATQSKTLAAVAGYWADIRHFDGASGVDRVRVVSADPAFFSVLGVEPMVGRSFRADDPPTVAVVSEALWRRRFEADPQIAGKTITLDDRVFSIIGVMPEVFEFPYRTGSRSADALTEVRTQAWVPAIPLRVSPTQVRQARVNVIGRLTRGVALTQAQAELQVIAARLEAESYRGTKTRVAFRATAVPDEILGPIRPALWILFAAVGLVLAAACANVANLLLARMLVRRREVVTRAALGASRLRLVRQFLAESLLLSLAGGAVGAAIAVWGTPLLLRYYAGRLPRLQEVALDWHAFAFLFLACLAAASLFGLAPALTAAGTDAGDVTRSAGGHATMGRKTRLVRDGLVVVEVALAFVLATGAAMLIGEIRRLRATPTGMNVENVVVLHMTPRTTAADYAAIESSVGARPGVHGAGFIQYVPLQNSGWMAGFEIKGRPSNQGERLVTELRYVTPGYFRAAGVPMVTGRGFLASDTADSPRVVLVNQTFARRYFAGEDAVGRELDRGVIVGVVGDVRSSTLADAPGPELYYTVAQNLAMTSSAGMALVVGTTEPPGRLLASIREAVVHVNPKLAMFNIRTMEEILSDSLWQLRLYRWLIGTFASVALVLAAIGLYAMIAYTASSRMREFAIRLALGSDAQQIVRLVFARGLSLALAGLTVGLIAVVLLSHWFGHVAGGIRPGLLSGGVVSLVLLAITVVACLVPSVRAATISPTAALRQE